MPVKREIIYPFFLECCEYADDIFWHDIFEDLAYGKPPYGTYISKGFFCCSYKNKEFSYKIQRKDIKTLYTDIYNLLTEKIGILSYKEKNRKRVEFHELEKTIKNSRNDWFSIRRKNIKDIMYEKFALDMKTKYSLTIKQTKYLISVILLCMMFKTITTKDIIYKDDKIEEIKGIRFEKGKVIIDIPISSNYSQIVQFEENPRKKISDNWEPFLNSLRTTKTNK